MSTNPFEPGTYGHAYFVRVSSLPIDRLRQMERANDYEITDSVDAEVARMVRQQALSCAIYALVR